MSKLPPHLTVAQTTLLEEIILFKREIVCHRKWKRRIEVWRYYSVDPIFDHEYPLSGRKTNIVKALIRKGVLVSEMSDKEFAIQFALGTIDHRVYKLLKDCVR